jgi:hypothetical protein
VDPGAGDAAAGVLGGGDRVLAAGTGLAAGAARPGLRAGPGVAGPGVGGRGVGERRIAERGVAERAQADRAGIGYREADPAGAEMIQVGLCYPLADRHPVSALSHPSTVAPAQRDWGKCSRRSGW